MIVSRRERGDASRRLGSSGAGLGVILTLAGAGGIGLHLLLSQPGADPWQGPAWPRIADPAAGLKALEIRAGDNLADPTLDEQLIVMRHRDHDCLAVGDWILALNHAPRQPGAAAELSADCRVAGGQWISPLDMVEISDAAAIVGSPVIPLAPARQAGLTAPAEREWHAPSRAMHFVWMPVSLRSWRNRAGRSIEDWTPATRPARCWYGQRWLSIKLHFRLTVTADERDALIDLLSECVR